MTNREELDAYFRVMGEGGGPSRDELRKVLSERAPPANEALQMALDTLRVEAVEAEAPQLQTVAQVYLELLETLERVKPHVSWSIAIGTSRVRRYLEVVSAQALRALAEFKEASSRGTAMGGNGTRTAVVDGVLVGSGGGSPGSCGLTLGYGGGGTTGGATTAVGAAGIGGAGTPRLQATCDTTRETAQWTMGDDGELRPTALGRESPAFYRELKSHDDGSRTVEVLPYGPVSLRGSALYASDCRGTLLTVETRDDWSGLYAIDFDKKKVSQIDPTTSLFQVDLDWGPVVHPLALKQFGRVSKAEIDLDALKAILERWRQFERWHRPRTPDGQHFLYWDTLSTRQLNPVLTVSSVYDNDRQRPFTPFLVSRDVDARGLLNRVVTPFVDIPMDWTLETLCRIAGDRYYIDRAAEYALQHADC